MPGCPQPLRAPPEAGDAGLMAFRARKRIETEARAAGLPLDASSLSYSSVTYKALCAADQLGAFYADLVDPSFEVAFAIFHQRYSTNTAPTWERAQPFRFLCHNGEINTIQGNVLGVRAKESHLVGGDRILPPELLRPVIDESGSDSSMLDNVVELLVRGGRSLDPALTMLIPAAGEGRGGASVAVGGARAIGTPRRRPSAFDSSRGSETRKKRSRVSFGRWLPPEPSPSRRWATTPRSRRSRIGGGRSSGTSNNASRR